MKLSLRLLLGGAAAMAGAGAFPTGAASLAAETIKYSYDPLGRLIAAENVAGTHAGQARSLCYDPAGNRTIYKSSSAGALADCPAVTPTPTPTPTPGTGPVANFDSTTMTVCTSKMVDVVGNDEGDPPLTLIAVSGPAAVGPAVANTTSVALTSGANGGSFTVSYTIRDTHGATATGSLGVTVSGGTCA